MQPSILVDLSDNAFHLELKQTKIFSHFTVELAENTSDWVNRLVTGSYTIALTDSATFSASDLDALLAGQVLNRTDVIFISDGNVHSIIDEAMRHGASFHFRRPVKITMLEELLEEIYKETLQVNHHANNPLATELIQFGLLVGSSPIMLKLYRTIRKVAETHASVLITGESGSGKELVAKTIHLISDASTPFVAINCGALSPELIESELFGHEKGAFTGADQHKKGVFEQAEGGTLFLDEVSEMHLEHQVKLLRVLESGEYRPVGSQHSKKANVRIISATNRNPLKAIEDELFREDLYFRLSHFPIELPPLRERGGDIVGLAKHFLAYRNTEEGTSKTISPGALKKIAAHSWPGNVRELKHTIERAYILANDTIDEANLSIEVLPTPKPDDDLRIPQGLALEELEKAAILQTLDQNQGNKKETANQLGVSVKTLYNKLEKYDDL